MTQPSGDKTNIHELRIVQIEEARAEQLLRNTEVKARIESLEAALERGGSREALTLLATRSSAGKASDTTSDALDRQLIDSLLEEQLLLENYGEDHPDVIAARKKVKVLRQHVGNLPHEKDGEPVDFLVVYLDSLRQELAVGLEQLAELDELFTQEQNAARSLATFQLADETYRNEIERTQALFDGVIKRLEEIHLVPDSGGVKTQVISPPGLGEQVEPNAVVVGLLSTAMGVLLGVFVAYVVDRTDQRFQSPEDLRRQLGLPLVGHIPVITPAVGAGRDGVDSRTLDPILCTFHNPDHAASEAYRAVRTSLYFSTGAGHRVVQITSPVPGDGKTTLGANLAIAAADSGRKVLLIEADFRRPRLAEVFSLGKQPGVSSVIAGETDLAGAIHATAVDNLSVMPCGPQPSNPSELLTSPRFEQLLEAAGQQFELILVDTPPLLAVTDPAVVAPRVDAVLLVIRLGRNVRYVAHRATEILESVGANVLGVVVNRLDHASRYGAGAYGYRYGYENKYGYHSGYGYGKAAGNGQDVKKEETIIDLHADVPSPLA